MQRDHAAGDGTDVRSMKEDVPHPSENCKGIKRNRSVSEDRASGQRKTDRPERMRGDKKKQMQSKRAGSRGCSAERIEQTLANRRDNGFGEEMRLTKRKREIGGGDKKNEEMR